MKKNVIPPTPTKSLPFGLGYKPTGLENMKQASKLARSTLKRTLNGQFIKEGEDYPSYAFPEPLVLEGIKKPGFEIFHDCNFLNG